MTLLHNASDLRRRLAVVSENATALVAWLRAQPAVAVRELCTVKKLPNECLLVAVGISRLVGIWGYEQQLTTGISLRACVGTNGVGRRCTQRPRRTATARWA